MADFLKKAHGVCYITFKFFAFFCGNAIIELLRVGAINYYMPAGQIEANWDRSPDTTPVSQFKVNITQRDLDEINHLVKRNMAGMTIAWTPAMIAVTKVLTQISKQDEELDNYDNDGKCPLCKAPEHEDTD